MPSRKLTAHCPQCGCKNHLRAAYCNQCGTRLKEPPAVKDDEGRAKLYADIAHPINSACREMIQHRVIAAFEEERERAAMPGYVPSYEDLDYSEAVVSAPASAAHAPPVEPAQIQGAEKPRGPHKMPSHRPQAEPQRSNEFGAGIFE